MCEEVFQQLNIAKKVFVNSQQRYTEDPNSRDELQKAIKTGQLSKETLNEQPDLAASMQLQLSAIQPLKRD